MGDLNNKIDEISNKTIDKTVNNAKIVTEITPVGKAINKKFQERAKKYGEKAQKRAQKSIKRSIRRAIISFIAIVLVIALVIYGAYSIVDRMVITGLLTAFTLVEKEEAEIGVPERYKWGELGKDLWGKYGEQDKKATLIPGLYPDDPVLKLKCQILEIAIETGGKLGVAPEDLFVPYYVEHNCELHFENEIADAYTDLSCVSGTCDYSSYFEGSDPKNGTPDKGSGVNYGPYGIAGSELDSFLRYYYEGEQAGGGGMANGVSGVMSATSSLTDFKRPNPLYFPDIMYNMALKISETQGGATSVTPSEGSGSIDGATTGGTTENPLVTEASSSGGKVLKRHDDLIGMDFETIDVRCNSGLTAEQINSVIEYKTKHRPNAKLKGYGQAFLEAERLTGVNALFWVALSCQETGLGDPDNCSIVKKNNFFSFGATDENTYENALSYDDITAGVIKGAMTINECYINNEIYAQCTLRKMTDPPPGDRAWHRYNAYDTWAPAIATIWAECCNKVIEDGGQVVIGVSNGVVSGDGSMIGISNSQGLLALGYSQNDIDAGHAIYYQWYQQVIDALTAEGKVGSSGGSGSNGSYGGGSLPDNVQGGTKLPASTTSNLESTVSKYLDKTYKYGASGPDSFDCSGLVAYIIKNDLGITWNYWSKTGTRSSQMAKSCVLVPWEQIMPGDLIFRAGEYGDYSVGKNLDEVQHVMMYVGNGKAIEASDKETGIRFVDIEKFKTMDNYFVGRPDVYYVTPSSDSGGAINKNGGTGYGTTPGSGGLPGSQFPLDLSKVTSVSSQFGYRYSDGSDLHNAVDLAAPSGTELHPVVDGMTVYQVKTSSSYGNQIVTTTTYKGTTIYVRYNHMCEPSTRKVGEIVNKTNIIGYVGTTGYSSGNHVDWEVFIGTYGDDSNGKASRSNPFELVGLKPYADCAWRQQWLESVGLQGKMVCDGACSKKDVWDKACKKGYYQFLCSKHNTEQLRSEHQAIEDKYSERRKSIWDL